ncbi:hypothetical protein HAZT_HAZT002585 [Hyalella azteca]|uniref:Alkaline phosphatase n=1 Tax=Hyalella azteca TaxID=294128 RepID=A0A6A0H6S4_HYAAZ|nr:hypothetical protein HAZT_HAZT002585 [Hyalella azteca]
MDVINKKFWEAKAQQDLHDILTRERNLNPAKNVVLFLGDGMGLPSITAARIYKGQYRGAVSGEEQQLVFETFPSVSLAKTYCVDKQVPDSACTATAFLCGVKTNYEVLGADAGVIPGNCTTLTDDNKLSSLASLALDAGKRAGFVTSTRVTHATPAALYAHIAHRDWECDEKLTTARDECPDVKDIAMQLVEDDPGRRLHVIMGGGRQYLSAAATGGPGDPIGPKDCRRQDGRNLMEEWLDRHERDGKRAAIVQSHSALSNLSTDGLQHLMGIFANGHVPYEHEKVLQSLDLPTLAQMTRKAIEVLQQGDKGFFLLVEGGRIDHGHHDNKARLALDELLAFDDAVQVALDMLDTSVSHDLKNSLRYPETLVVVTADHSHVMTMNGYPPRGQSITSFASMGDDLLPYTTLMYTNGPGFNFSVVNNTAARFDVSKDDVSSFNYTQLSSVLMKSETHGGEDVAVYAIGPMSHLFEGVHEQNYIAHAVAYAACVGANKAHCQSAASPTVVPHLVLILSLGGLLRGV